MAFPELFFLDCFNTFRLICALCFSWLHFWIFLFLCFLLQHNFHQFSRGHFKRIFRTSIFVFFVFFLFFLCFFLACFTLSKLLIFGCVYLVNVVDAAFWPGLCDPVGFLETFRAARGRGAATSKGYTLQRSPVRPSVRSFVRSPVCPTTMTIDGETRLNRRRRAAARSRRAIHLNRLKRSAAAQIKRRRLPTAPGGESVVRGQASGPAGRPRNICSEIEHAPRNRSHRQLPFPLNARVRKREMIFTPAIRLSLKFSSESYLNYLGMRHTRAFASSFGTRLTALAADSKQAAAATQLLRVLRCLRVRSSRFVSSCCCCCCRCRWLQAPLLRGSDRHIKLCSLQSALLRCLCCCAA